MGGLDGLMSWLMHVAGNLNTYCDYRTPKGRQQKKLTKKLECLGRFDGFISNSGRQLLVDCGHHFTVHVHKLLLKLASLLCCFTLPGASFKLFEVAVCELPSN